MSGLKYDKIPIWENKQRIKDLTFWRDLWLQGTSPDVKVLISPATGKPFGVEERRGELNRRIPLVREIVALADISTVRDWKTVRKDAGTVRVDILEQFWYVETLRLSYRAPSDVVDEAIGKYQADQRGGWIRTFNPVYWIGRLIEWLIGLAFNVVRLFGRNPQTARNSRVGRTISAIGKFLAWVATVGGFLIQFPAVRHLLHLP